MEKEVFSAERVFFTRLKAAGFQPGVIYDVGASDGSWSETMAGVFPDARFHLFEPLARHAASYRTALADRLRRFPGFSLHAVALGNTNCEAPIFVARDVYGSSVLDRGDVPEVQEEIQVPHHRLDDYAARLQLPAPDIIKIDCQGAELRILQGGQKALENASALLLETWLMRCYGPETPLVGDLLDLLQARSFTPVEIGERFYDDGHRLYSIDVFFATEQLLRETRLVKSDAVSRTAPGAGTAWSSLAGLTRKLADLVESVSGAEATGEGLESAAGAAGLTEADAIITHIEVNARHGTGVLLGRLFHNEPGILSVRSADYFGGQQDFGDLALRISHSNKAREAVFARVLDAVDKSTVRRILCVPYLPDDVRNAVALKEIFDAPLAAYLLDDQNICAEGIPDELMRELLAKAALRLAGSPELRQAYEAKYGFTMWYLPPVVDSRLISSRLLQPPAWSSPGSGVIIGNIWGRRWLELLRNAVRGSGARLNWYCNGGLQSIPCEIEELRRDFIYPHEPPDDEQLVRILRSALFAVLPTGPLDQADDRRFITALSLPSRLIYLMATAQLPVLVLGSPHSAAANFVRQFSIGMVADYDSRAFAEAVRMLSEPARNLAMRRNALLAAARFGDAGVAEWIWRSLERGEPVDRRFEDLMPPNPPDLPRLVQGKPGPAWGAAGAGR